MERKGVVRKNIIQALVTACVTFVLLIIRTADISTALLIAFAVFLSYMMWVVIYYRNPNRREK